MLNLKKSTNIIFKDDEKIPLWAKEHVYSAVAAGIIKGFADNEFKSNGFLTRAELAVIITKCFGNNSYNDGKTGFKDDIDIPLWAKAYVKKAVDENIISGYKDNTYKAKLPATRAEFCVLVERLKGKLDN